MLMKKYAAYLFDFDYTLADSSAGIVKCFRIVLERHGHMNIDDYTIKRTIGKTLEQAFTIMTGIDDPQILAGYRKEYVREADLYMTAFTHLFPETLDVLQILKKQGAKVGIISTKYRYRIQELLQPLLPSDFLDVLIGGEDVHAAKPDPEGLLMALQHIGVPTDEALYIGDSIVDAQTAQAAGTDFAGVLHGMTTRDELEGWPNVAVMNDLNELLSYD